jgi:quinol monooxygenase YgiN
VKPPVYCIVDFRVMPEHVTAARRHMRRAERTARGEAGCIQYHFLQDLDDPAVFTGYGIFASGSDAERHFEKVRADAAAGRDLAALLDRSRPVTLRTLDRI